MLLCIILFTIKLLGVIRHYRYLDLDNGSNKLGNHWATWLTRQIGAKQRRYDAARMRTPRVDRLKLAKLHKTWECAYSTQETRFRLCGCYICIYWGKKRHGLVWTVVINPRELPLNDVRRMMLLSEMSGLWKFSVRVQSWSDKISSDPVLIRNFFENRQSDPVLIRQCKSIYVYFASWDKRTAWTIFSLAKYDWLKAK